MPSNDQKFILINLARKIAIVINFSHEICKIALKEMIEKITMFYMKFDKIGESKLFFHLNNKSQCKREVKDDFILFYLYFIFTPFFEKLF